LDRQEVGAKLASFFNGFSRVVSSLCVVVFMPPNRAGSDQP
jgi:hypothetical protein